MALKVDLKGILDVVYGGNLDEKDMAAILRQVFRRLDVAFSEEPPTRRQSLVLRQILVIADEVETFTSNDRNSK